MSLMSRRLTAGPVGTQGTWTQVRLRCRVLSRDMKSQTANAWCSMNVTTASLVSSFRYSGWLTTFWRAGSTESFSFSIAGLVSSQSYRDTTVPLHPFPRYRLLSISQHTWPELTNELAPAWRVTI